MLHLSDSFLAEFDILLRRPLRLLLERVENEDGTRQLRDVEDSVLCLAVYANLHDSRPDTRHRSIVVWVKAELDQVKLMPRLAACVFGKVPEIDRAPALR